MYLLINMKRYKSLKKQYLLLDRHMLEFKAWYNPSSNWFRQFSTNGTHLEIAEDELKMNEAEALRRGYYRIYLRKDLNIDSYKVPTDREFKAIQDIIEKNSYKKFKGTRWQVINPNHYYYFPYQSFLYAESLAEGI